MNIRIKLAILSPRVSPGDWRTARFQEQAMVRFIPAAELKEQFGVFGHFYTVRVTPQKQVDCRSVLEIVLQGQIPADLNDISGQKPDAVFIMMNPGSSQPLVEVHNSVSAAEIQTLAVSLVPTKPDTTQYQVMRLMHYCGWRHVRVLNLSDLRCAQSVEFFKQFQHLEESFGFDAHSVFSTRRNVELAGKLARPPEAPVVFAWGLSPSLEPLIERCLAQLGSNLHTLGLEKEGAPGKYLHPLPTLQRQKIEWVNRMVDQCRGG
jgi:hypothetical protein